MSDPQSIKLPWTLAQKIYALLEKAEPNRAETEALFDCMSKAADAHDKEVRL